MRALSAALGLALALAAAGSDAGAQYTTVIAPQGKKQQQQKQAALTAAQKQAHLDSLQRASITGMKAWVDSAALALSAGGADSTRSRTVVVATDTTRRDSTVRDTTRAATSALDSIRTPRTPTRTSAAGEVQTQRRDSVADSTRRARPPRRAPNTATPLPTIALAGGLLVLAGLALRRRARS